MIGIFDLILKIFFGPIVGYNPPKKGDKVAL